MCSRRRPLRAETTLASLQSTMTMVVSHPSLPIFRVGSDSLDHTYLMNMEKRQLFLRSYQFSRKKTLTERIRSSLVRVKRLILARLRCVRKLRKLVWSQLLCYRRRRRRSKYYSRLRFLRSHNNGGSSVLSSSSCFW